MSSRSPPLPPLYPREAHSPPSSMSVTQGALEPIQLPAPPPMPEAFYRQPRYQPTYQYAPINMPPAPGPPPHPPPAPFFQQPYMSSYERLSSIPLEQSFDQPSPSPRSNPPYSFYYRDPMQVQGQSGQRPYRLETSPVTIPRASERYLPPYYTESQTHSQPFPAQFAVPSIPTPSSLGAAPPGENQVTDFEITVRQQPQAARACGFGERDRRVIDPPPIVQLTVKGSSEGEALSAQLRYPFNIVHCTLWNEEGTVDETEIAGQERRVNRRLMGTLVASPFVGADEHGQEGCFFCFPDLSCRTHGRYRLRFVMTRIEMDNPRPGATMPIVASATSDLFTVFSAKEFPGMRASTDLTIALKRQGCAISVKKGKDKDKDKAGTTRSRRDDDTDDNDGGGGGGGDADEPAPSSAAGGRSKRRRKG